MIVTITNICILATIASINMNIFAYRFAKNAPHIEHWYIIFNKKVQYRKIVLFFTSRDVKKRHYRIYPIISDTNSSIGIHLETTPYFETHTLNASVLYSGILINS